MIGRSDSPGILAHDFERPKLASKQTTMYVYVLFNRDAMFEHDRIVTEMVFTRRRDAVDYRMMYHKDDPAVKVRRARLTVF